MKKSLCIDARMWFSSGIGTYLRQLVPRIQKMHEWDLTLLIKEEDKTALQFLTDVKKIGIDSSIYSLLSHATLSQVIPKCDLFWSPHYTIPLFPIKAKKRVVTIHDVCHIDQKESFSWVKRKGAHFLLSRAMKQSDILLTISSFSQKEIFRYFPLNQKKVHVVSCGSHLKSERVTPSIKSLGVHSPFILYVGNIKPHKNILRLLEAFKRFPEGSMNLVLAGSVSMPLPHLGTQVQLREGLSEEDLATLYTHAELLIQPSLYEGFGLTPLEAMSYGCPVVSSSAASLPEVCAESAIYIDPLNTESIYLGMKRVLEDVSLKENLISKGYERIKQFSWDDSAKKIVDLFLEAL